MGVTARTVQTLEGASAVALVLMMMLVMVDVAGRNLLNMPVPWGTEVLEMMVAAMVFLLYPVLALQSRHITVDLFQVRPALRLVQRLLGAAVGSVLFAIIAWCLRTQTLRSAGYGEASPVLGVPLSWVLGTMCVLAAATTLAFVVSAARIFRAGVVPSVEVY